VEAVILRSGMGRGALRFTHTSSYLEEGYYHPGYPFLLVLYTRGGSTFTQSCAHYSDHLPTPTPSLPPADPPNHPHTPTRTAVSTSPTPPPQIYHPIASPPYPPPHRLPVRAGLPSRNNALVIHTISPYPGPPYLPQTRPTPPPTHAPHGIPRPNASPTQPRLPKTASP
jgi:hypothetical protein